MFEDIRELYTLLKKERFFNILLLASLIIMLGALAIFFSDHYYESKGVEGLFDAIYWAVVTVATVGYGDVVPVSRLSKVFAMVVILCGAGVISLVTASIASVFVEKKIREGKGLEDIKEKNHIVICGWNENGDKVIDGVLLQSKGASPAIVLVNELDRDEVQSIQYRYKDRDLHFVRGNFVKEDVLARANITKAKAAIVLADASGGHRPDKADERTIFGTMAIKSMASKVRTCAELIHPENREHLLRANVDEIIVRGESAGSLMATAAVSPGMADTIKLLINNQDANKLWRIPAPSRYIERPLGEAASHLREKFGALVLAVVKEEEGMKLEQILSDDSSFIDQFIKRKFEESGKDFFGQKKGFTVVINPPDTYKLHKSDWLIVVSRERPS